jgi:hypothetical protein
MAEYNKEHETVLENMMKGLSGAEAGRMFGFPAYLVNGKLAVGVKKEGIVAKIGAKRAQEMIGKPGVSKYEPLPGRVWKDYVLLTGSFDQYKNLFAEAVRYVQAETA